MKLDFKKREVDITFYGGVKKKISFPSSREMREYQKALMKENADYLDVTFSFIVKLGCTKELLEDLQMPDLEELVAVLCGQKKT